jgi:hypothetical protein
MRYRTVKLAALAVIALLTAVCPILTSTATESAPQRRTQPRPNRGPKPQATYREFSHTVAQHRQACDTCHKFPTANWKQVRKGDEAFPDVTEYPEHASCLNCHRQQFFKGAQPAICSVCHQEVTPRGGARHPFPNPAETFDKSKKGELAVTDFQIYFPHDKHIDIVGQGEPGSQTGRGRFVAVSFGGRQESEPKSCAVCHQTYQPQNDSDEEFVTKPPKDLAEDAFWLKKGTFKTSPSGHATCFTCHSEESGLKPAPADCATCHRLLSPGQVVQLTEARGDFDPQLAARMGIKDKTTLEKWGRRNTAKFRHEWIPHAGVGCVSCHNVAQMNTLDEKTKKVPVLSCGGEGSGCHIEATTEGILNLEVEKKKASAGFQCVKCHVNNGKLPLPESHASAVSKAGKK